MSVKKHYELITHEVTEQVLVGQTRYCDVCKKEIEKNKGYWKFTTGHNDWGNDSCESIEYFDVCSGVCLTSKFTEYLDESKCDYNTMYFNAERTF